MRRICGSRFICRAKIPVYVGDNFQFIARLNPGVTSAQAAAELTGLNGAIYRQFPTYNQWAMGHAGIPEERLWPLQQILVSGARTSLLALSAAVLAILLMTCLNLAGLISARAVGRQGEMALRAALGAARGAMFRLLLVESLVLGLAGSVLGIVVAWVALPLLLASSPIDLPQLPQRRNQRAVHSLCRCSRAGYDACVRADSCSRSEPKDDQHTPAGIAFG